MKFIIFLYALFAVWVEFSFSFLFSLTVALMNVNGRRFTRKKIIIHYKGAVPVFQCDVPG